MRRVLLVILALAVVGVGGYLVAYHTAPGPADNAGRRPGRIVIHRPTFNKSRNDYELKPEVIEIPREGDPMVHTLEAVLATGNDERAAASAIPPHTRLLGLQAENGRVTVNLSQEFAGVNQKGDTGESLAQNTLRAALGQFPDVKTMTVHVDGKPFEGEHSGAWTDIPVRDNTARGGEAP